MGFYSGNIRDLTHDLKALRPTIIPAVPRLLNRVYDKYQSDLAGSPIRRMFFNMAIKAKEADIKRQVLRKNTIWDRFAFRNVQECKFSIISISFIVPSQFSAICFQSNKCVRLPFFFFFCEAFGGNVRLMLIGSAPLAAHVVKFMRCALSCLIIEGYGQTECTAPVTLAIQGDVTPDHVGPPVACCCIKVSRRLADAVDRLASPETHSLVTSVSRCT